MLSSPNLDLSKLKPHQAAEADEVGVEIPSADGEIAQPQAPPEKLSLQHEVQIFSSTFLTVLLAELGDKTQVTTLLMSAQSKSPWVVFAGAGAALIMTSLLGVLLGRWLSQRVSSKTLETSTGAMLLLISVLLFWDVLDLPSFF